MIEVNPGPDYLGAGLSPLPTVYGVMAGFYLAAGLFWITLIWPYRKT